MKQPFTIRLDQSLIDRLDNKAKSMNDQKRNYVIEKACQEFINKQQQGIKVQNSKQK